MVALQNEIQTMMNIGLIGCGMWGHNLARNLAQLEVLAAVADRQAKNAAEFGSTFATIPVTAIPARLAPNLSNQVQHTF